MSPFEPVRVQHLETNAEVRSPQDNIWWKILFFFAGDLFYPGQATRYMNEGASMGTSEIPKQKDREKGKGLHISESFEGYH